MAAIRCAARRLGGSLLQRTQAAVAEEGRLLAPSRLMRSRHLSTQVSGERSQVPERLLLEPGLIMRNHQLASEITKRLQEPSAEEYEVQCRMEALFAKWDKLAELHKEELEKSAPDAFELGVKAYGNAAKSVVRVAAKSLMYFCMICSVILGDK